ncbi:alpha-galactosidase [Humibacter ginsengiterrae]
MSANDSARLRWHLRTRGTSYIVSVTPDGSGLVLDYWGPSISEDALDDIPQWNEPERFVSFSSAADVQPLEYASDGQRHASFSELLIDRGSGRTGARWSVVRDEVLSRRSDGGDELVVPFDEETGTLRLELRARTSREHDVIRRSARLVNRGADRIELPRMFSAAWNLPLGQDVHVDYLGGSWAHEFQRRSIDLHWGTFSLGSRQGVTSLSFSPVVTVSALNDAESFQRQHGNAYGVALEWSGSWRLQVETAAVGQHARVSCGVHEDVTTVVLAPGEEFSTPDSLGIFSAESAAGVSRGWHEFQRAELARDLSPRARPIVYNSWMATAFDVAVEQQKTLAREAAALGVETFVLDDGWFAGRTSDRAGLGDWQPDPVKFPNGLAELATVVEGLGMRFGIWVEPECVNPDSELYRLHPDWVYRADGRPLETIRNQYVLDLGRNDVVEWVMDMLRTLLSSASIGYLKWDMNRPITDGGRPGSLHGREWSVQHTRNFYRVLEMLRSEHPDLVVEACASGGARIDNAVLARADVVWPSDQVGARDRLVIQHGFLSAYPAWTMSSWVSDDAGHRDRQPVSLGYRFAVAMAGVLGIGSDLSSWSEVEKTDATSMVQAYKEIRKVVHHGDVRTHGLPGENLYAIEFAGPPDDPRVVILVYDSDRDRTRDRELSRVFPTALRLGCRYEVRDGFGRFGGDVVTAESVSTVGLPVRFSWAQDAEVLVLTPLDEY